MASAVLKNDQLKARIDKVIDADNNLFGLAKLIGQDTLEEFARALAGQHRPSPVNWSGKFGLPATPPPAERTTREASSIGPVGNVSEASSAASPTGRNKSKLLCSACGVTVSYGVAKFCWVHKPRFDGLIYCMECQKAVSNPG